MYSRHADAHVLVDGWAGGLRCRWFASKSRSSATLLAIKLAMYGGLLRPRRMQVRYWSAVSSADCRPAPSAAPRPAPSPAHCRPSAQPSTGVPSECGTHQSVRLFTILPAEVQKHLERVTWLSNMARLLLETMSVRGQAAFAMCAKARAAGWDASRGLPANSALRERIHSANSLFESCLSESHTELSTKYTWRIMVRSVRIRSSK